MRDFSAAHFLSRYEGIAGALPGPAAPRAAAAAILARAGLPDTREEAWKYTGLGQIATLRFHEALTDAGENRAPPAATLPDLGDLADAPRLVFAQGRRRDDLCKGAEAFTGSRFDASSTLARPERDRLVALNTMLTEDGATLTIAAGEEAGTLLLISQGSDLTGTPVAFHPRHTLHLCAGARLALVEIAHGSGVYLHNPVTEITLEPGAELTHVRLQQDSADAFHLATLYVDIAENAGYHGFSLNLGGKLARTEIHARLHGSHAHAAVNAVQLLGGTQHGDFTTVVTHAAPDGVSRQTVKNVLDGHARGVFQGKIEVLRHAQKTDGYQMNQGLLLSPHAELDCKPQLEIYADDVKCSHGATIGELDPEQLFYLRSRGIGEVQARAMLVQAFVAESFAMVAHDGARALLERAATGFWGAL